MTPRCLNAWRRILVAIVPALIWPLCMGGTGELHAAPRTPVSGVAPNSPRTWIVAVGIDHYRDNYWPALRFAAQDAKNLSTILGNNGELPSEVLLLQDQAATAASVRDTFQKIRGRVNPADRLIVYFSGHGTLAPGGAGGDLAQILVMHDTDATKALATGISHDELRRMLDRIPVRRKLLILATCHSGVGKSRLSPVAQELLAGSKGRIAKSVFTDDDAASEGFLIFAASARGETAREDPSVRGDIYTHFFLEATSAGDRDGDGQVTALEAHDYARQKTSAMTRGTQRPTMEGKAIGRFDFSLSGRKRNNGRPVLTAYESSLQGYGIQVRGGEKGTVPSGFVMKEGENVIQVFAPDSDEPLTAFSLRASEGETITLDEVVRLAPFGVSYDYSKASFRDPRSGRIAPKSGIALQSARFTYQISRMRWPLLIGASGYNSEFSRSGGAPGIQTSSTLQAFKAEAGVRVADFRGRFASAVLVFGQANLGLAIKDSRSGGMSRYTSKSNVLGFDAAAGAQMKKDWDLYGLAGARFEQMTFAFSDLGKVRLDHVAWYLGLEMRFGARARRLF